MRLLLSIVCLTAGAGAARAQTPLNTNLLANSGFEAGTASWTPVSSAPSVVSYGSTNYPSPALSTAIGGGGLMVTNTSGTGSIEQVVALTGLPPGAYLDYGGFAGGGLNDEARIVARFLNASGAEIALHPLDLVTDSYRNFETVLMRTDGQVLVPPGAAQVALRVELVSNCCGVAVAAADNLFAEIRVGSLTPAPQPDDVNLLENSSFEGGWAPGSPLVPTSMQSWRGFGSDATFVAPYSDLDPFANPGTLVSCLIDGGLPGFSCFPGGSGNLLFNVDEARLRQRLDVRGNTPQFATFGSRALALEAYLGGAGDISDNASVQVVFRNESLTTLSALPVLGPVTNTERNEETVLLKRTSELFVPPGTAYIDVDLYFEDACCGAAFAFVDRLDARLTAPSSPVPATLGTDLVRNGSFEQGDLPGSPLQLNVEESWNGLFSASTSVLSYGSSSAVPGTAFAAGAGLGGQVLQDGSGDAGLFQVIDLRGNKSGVDAGHLRAYVQAWLGGFADIQDNARVEIRCLNANGVQVGGAGGFRVLGPVTSAERGNQTTLLLRTDEFAVPVGTADIEVQILMDNACCGGAFGLVDDVRIVLTDINSGSPLALPGSGEDLRLATGVNTQPATGPGNELKTAVGGLDLLNLDVFSPEGDYDFGGLMVGATAYGAGGPQYPLLLPDVLLDVNNVVLLLNGLNCFGFGCDLVLPGGTPASFFLPAALSGLTLRIQGLVFPASGSGTFPANGAYATTEAHELQVL